MVLPKILTRIVPAHVSRLRVLQGENESEPQYLTVHETSQEASARVARERNASRQRRHRGRTGVLQKQRERRHQRNR